MSTRAAPEVREPRQARSRRTRERILAAVERLLEARLFEQLTVQAIVAEARATTGSFYNLFADKRALLPELYRRHCVELLGSLEALLDERRWRGEDLGALIAGLVRRIVRLHVRRRGLLRALVLEAHCRPAARRADRPPEMDGVIPRVARLIATRRSRIAHREPEKAAARGLVMVLATVREYVLYPETTAYVAPASERALADELTRAFLGYLGAPR